MKIWFDSVARSVTSYTTTAHQPPLAAPDADNRVPLPGLSNFIAQTRLQGSLKNTLTANALNWAMIQITDTTDVVSYISMTLVKHWFDSSTTDNRLDGWPPPPSRV